MFRVVIYSSKQYKGALLGGICDKIITTIRHFVIGMISS